MLRSARREASRAADPAMRGELAKLAVERLKKRLEEVEAELAERLKRIEAMKSDAR